MWWLWLACACSAHANAPGLPRLRGPRLLRYSSSLLSSEAVRVEEAVRAEDVCALAPCKQNCTVTETGNYKCGCFDGYEFVYSAKVPNGECVDVDECAVNNGGCPQACFNAPGNHSCACLSGYATVPQFNGTHNSTICVDIDECLLGHCAHGCTNLLGSVQCDCRPGFTLDPDGRNCTDVDECAQTDPKVCNHFCHNRDGSFECGCFPGYAMAASGTCDDVDECKDLNGGCDFECMNSLGSHYCICPEGTREVFGACVAPLPAAPVGDWPAELYDGLMSKGKIPVSMTMDEFRKTWDLGHSALDLPPIDPAAAPPLMGRWAVGHVESALRRLEPR